MRTEPTWTHVFVDVPHGAWERSVDFWAQATSTRVSSPWGDEEQYLSLVPVEGDAWVHLQRIDGPPRVHLDLDSVDPVSAQRHSSSLEARAHWDRPEALAMTSPGGQWFCHSHDGGRRVLVRRDPERVLDQVCIDIPAAWWEREVGFWRAVMARDLVDSGSPEFALLPEEGRVRVLLQRLGEQSGPVRAHPDFATADREVEARRHESLGAVRIEVFEQWTVMRAPDGHTYCLTDRDPLTGLPTP